MESEGLDFAFRYPFSEEAKSIIQGMELKKVDRMHLAQAREHIESLLGARKQGFIPTESNYIKKDYIVTYLYSRMMVSAVPDLLVIEKFAESEAKRSSDSLRLYESNEGIARLGKELGLEVRQTDGQFTINFVKYLRNRPNKKEYALVNQRLEKGRVFLDKNETVSVIEGAIKDRIKEGLPIGRKDLPTEVLAFYKENPISRRMPRARAERVESRGWIDRLLEYPILDGRHRVVNLVLAPYFVNVRKMDMEEAVKKINEYIERCKAANPDTRITEQYIRYQCNYAKRKGLRVLSLKRAKELIGEELMDRIAG